MASTPVTAPSPVSPSPPSPTPPSTSPPLESESDPSPPPPTTPVTAPPPSDTPETPSPISSSPPPPTSSQPPPSSSPPPTTKSPSPPSPPPDDNSNTPSPPPPSNDTGSSPSPPPPTNSSSSPPPPPTSSNSPVTPPPPPVSFSAPTPPNSSNALSPPPPPPPRAAKHSPPSHNSTTTNSSTPSSDLSVPIIAGIAAGVGVLVILLAIVMFCCCCKKKKKKKPPMGYYGDPHGGHKVDYYNGGQHQPGWNNGPPQPMDHIVKVGGQNMGPPSSGQWPPPLPPPPPPLMSSSDMSSQYSGPGPRPNPLPPPSPNISLGFSKSTFTYQELAAATSGFSQANLLGQGGFGYVHKGVLPNGKEVAVKSLKSGSGQGEREFQAEVEIISRVHHRHLVSLVGYCIAGQQRMLVYEFVPNGTLEFHLYGSGRPTMDWPTRLKIALGSAKGLAYLHEDCHPRIIHRDIKTANILLDYKFEAMVADFGLAKLSSDNYTHVSTRVMGTFGYLAPEYASSGKLTEKSDVFSYGVMLLELITGRRPVDTTNTYMEDSLVDWARPLMTSGLADGNYVELVDPRLENSYNHNEMTRLVACAAASVRHSARRRPKMSQIVRALEGDSSLEDLNDGVRPGSMLGSSSGGSDHESYNTEMKRIRKVATGSEEFGGSSEYGPTSEYGMNPSSSSSEAPHSREMEPRL